MIKHAHVHFSFTFLRDEFASTDLELLTTHHVHMVHISVPKLKLTRFSYYLGWKHYKVTYKLHSVN